MNLQRKKIFWSIVICLIARANSCGGPTPIPPVEAAVSQSPVSIATELPVVINLPEELVNTYHVDLHVNGPAISGEPFTWGIEAPGAEYCKNAAIPEVKINIPGIITTTFYKADKTPGSQSEYYISTITCYLNDKPISAAQLIIEIIAPPN